MAGSSAYAGEGDETLITDINVTPLVDVVLVLLIVLMITMPVIVSTDLLNEREMSILLPQASEARPLITKPTELFINVDKDGVFTVHSQRYTEQGLLRLLQQANADNPGRVPVIIRADKNCRLQAAVVVMNLCNKSKMHYKLSTGQ